MAERYQLVIRAEGEVRDQDGNLISTETVSGQSVITEEQAQQIQEMLAKQAEVKE